MITLGNTLVRPYRNLGQCSILDSTNSVIEEIPWFSEQKVYKGKTDIVYPFLNNGTTNALSTSQTLVSFFSQGSTPSSLEIYEPGSFKYGSFRKNSATTMGSDTNGSTTPVGNVMVFNVNRLNPSPALSVLNNPYYISEGIDLYIIADLGSVLRNFGHTCNSLCIDNTTIVTRGYYQTPALQVDFGATILASKNITMLRGLIRRAETTETDEPALGYFENWGSSDDGEIIASFGNFNLWYVHSYRPPYELNQSGFTYVKPGAGFLYDTSNDSNWHCQVVSMYLCAHLSNYY